MKSSLLNYLLALASIGKHKRLMLGLKVLTTEEFQSCAGDEERIAELLASPEVQARIDEEIAKQEEEISEQEEAQEEDRVEI